MNALEVLRKHRDENEYHSQLVGEEWIVEAMEEYSGLTDELVRSIMGFIESVCGDGLFDNNAMIRDMVEVGVIPGFYLDLMRLRDGYDF